MKIIEIIFIISANILWFRSTLKFERKIRFRGVNRYIQRTTRRQLVIIKSSIDKTFDKLTKDSNAYFDRWREEEKMLHEICSGTRPYDDLNKFVVLKANKNTIGLSINQRFFGNSPISPPIPQLNSNSNA